MRQLQHGNLEFRKSDYPAKCIFYLVTSGNDTGWFFQLPRLCFIYPCHGTPAKEPAQIGLQKYGRKKNPRKVQKPKLNEGMQHEKSSSQEPRTSGREKGDKIKKVPNKQALQNRNLGPSSKKHHNGKIQAFGTKSGLFWDHCWTFLGLLVIIFMKLQKTCKKDKNTRCCNISHFKIYLMVSRYETLMRGPESIKYMHMIHCICLNRAQQ